MKRKSIFLKYWLVPDRMFHRREVLHSDDLSNVELDLVSDFSLNPEADLQQS